MFFLRKYIKHTKQDFLFVIAACRTMDVYDNKILYTVSIITKRVCIIFIADFIGRLCNATNRPLLTSCPLSRQKKTACKTRIVSLNLCSSINSINVNFLV